MLTSKLFLLLDALASVNFINDPREKSEQATDTKQNVISIVTEKAFPNAVSDGYMLDFHEVFSLKKSDAMGSAELRKKKGKVKRQKIKSCVPDQQKVQAAHNRFRELSDSNAVDKRTKLPYGKERGIRF